MKAAVVVSACNKRRLHRDSERVRYSSSSLVAGGATLFASG